MKKTKKPSIDKSLIYEKVVRANKQVNRYGTDAADADLYRNFQANESIIEGALIEAVEQCKNESQTDKDYNYCNKLIKKIARLKTKRGFDRLVDDINSLQNKLNIKVP